MKPTDFSNSHEFLGHSFRKKNAEPASLTDSALFCHYYLRFALFSAANPTGRVTEVRSCRRDCTLFRIGLSRWEPDHIFMP